jgi:hypothetical protein
MKKFLLLNLAAAFSFFFSTSPTHAMTIPHMLHLDGLIFFQGLEVDDPLITTQIRFGEIDKITVKKTANPVVLAEKIVSPSPVKKLSIKPLLTKVEVEEKDVVTQTVPTPTHTPTPTPQPVVTTSHPVGGLDVEKLFSMINGHRTSIGLAPFQKDANLCSLAQSRAPELPGEIANGSIHAGFRSRNLPYWATENMIHQDTEEEAFSWWMNSGLHRISIEGSHKYSCGACQG